VNKDIFALVKFFCFCFLKHQWTLFIVSSISYAKLLQPVMSEPHCFK